MIYPKIRINLRDKVEELFINIYSEFGLEVDEEKVLLKIEYEYANNEEEGYLLLEELIKEGYITENSKIFKLHI